MIIKGIGMLFVIICCVGAGIAMGMYIVSQIENSIDKNIDSECYCQERWKKIKKRLTYWY